MFPIFLILAWRFGKNKVFWMIMLMAAISLLLSEWGWRNKANANFYLAPKRTWELFAGSIAAFIAQHKGVQKNNALALIGLLAIVFSIFAYNEQTPFPSVYTLIPVLGVVLLVLYADKETFTAKLLSIKLFVGIGLISYSAYLWHQPMLVFAKLYFNDYVITDIILAVIATTFVLSWVTWRYIETPFRRGSALTRKYIFFRALIALSAFVVIGLSYHFSLIPQKEVKLVWRGVTHDLPKKFGGIRLNDKNCSARAPVDSCVLGEGEK